MDDYGAGCGPQLDVDVFRDQAADHADMFGGEEIELGILALESLAATEGGSSRFVVGEGPVSR